MSYFQKNKSKILQICDTYEHVGLQINVSVIKNYVQRNCLNVMVL